MRQQMGVLYGVMYSILAVGGGALAAVYPVVLWILLVKRPVREPSAT
jgi:hypothetical protein